MQTIQIIGYLGKDAEIRSFAGNDNSEQKVLTFSVGVTRKYKDKEQTKHNLHSRIRWNYS